jgi:hypothetical protein
MEARKAPRRSRRAFLIYFGTALILGGGLDAWMHAAPHVYSRNLDTDQAAKRRDLPVEEPTFVPPTLRHPKLTTLLAETAESIRQNAQSTAPGLVPQGVPETTQAQIAAKLPEAVQDALRSGMMRMDRTGAIQIYIELTGVNSQIIAQLQAADAKIEITDSQHDRIQAIVPPASLLQLESLPFVRFIRLPNYAVHNTGSVDTQGDAILEAQQARAQLNIDGTGVRVGVISDGIKGVFATSCTTCQGVAGGPISTGDLPQSTGTRNSSGVLVSSNGGITGKSFQTNGDLEGLPSGTCGFPGAGAEGTAILEIVYDIAPGAQLLFENAGTDMEFNQAVNDLASKADVVMDDINFFGLPYDGTSVVSQNTANALNSASNPIRAYFTAVGNNARQHYLGLYQDSGVDGTKMGLPAGDLHLFQATSITSDILNLGPTPEDRVILPNQGEVVVVLTWDDPWGASSNNYDLYFLNEATGAVAAASADIQNGAQDPVEFIDYTNKTGAQANFDIVVQNVNNQAQPKHLTLFLFQPECAVAGPLPIASGHPEIHNYNTISSSVAAEADAGGSPASVSAVGAIAADDPGNKDIEFFSSNGPTLDGRVKPDVTGIDGVSTTGAGDFENPFYGTSAAAPHAAGIAALLLQAAPCLLSSSSHARNDADARMALLNLVEGNSVPLGSPIPNNIFGYGRLNALAAAEQTVPTASALTTESVSGNSPTGFSGSLPANGFSDAQQCPITVTATGGCSPSTGSSTVNCPFGSSSVTLMGTADGVTFSTPIKTQIIVTSFKVGASPASNSIAPGQSASYQITVSPQFGPYGNAISLACTGLPPEAACVFTPPTVTPNSQAATVQLAISTAAASWLLPMIQFNGIGNCVWLLGFGALFLLLRRAVWVNSCPAWARNLAAFLALASILAGLAVLPDCGGGNSSSMNPGTPAGTYTVNVTATAGTLVVTTPVTLTVQ